MGAAMGLLGAVFGIFQINLQVILQKPWITVLVALLFAGLSLSLFDVYTLQTPRWLQKPVDKLNRKQQSGSYTGAAAMGALSILVVSPCATPILTALLLFTTQTTPLKGATALFFFGLGTGLPLLLFAGAFRKFLPKAGAWMDNVKKGFAFALLAIAIEKRGVPAVSYTGAQVKILTDSAHMKARIKGIDSDNIRRDLDAGKIVIVAGFQGVDEHGNITTLGRGGSDTTAVALAAALHAELARLDPQTAASIKPNDRQRLVRALELILTTGQTPSALYAAQQTRRPPWPTLAIGLNPARAVLHQRIAERFQMMIAQGFIEEVAALKARPQLSLAAPSMRSVGYRQIWQYLDGASDRESAIEQAIIASRQLAKRQITWMNNRLGRDLAISQYDPLAKPTAALDAIEKYLQQPPAKPI